LPTFVQNTVLGLKKPNKQKTPDNVTCNLCLKKGHTKSKKNRCIFSKDVNGFKIDKLSGYIKISRENPSNDVTKHINGA